MGEWKRVKIRDALKEVSREEKLNPNTKYRLLGVRWYGKGVFQREEKLGKEIKATKLYRAKKGDFIYNRLFAWKSSFAIVPDEFDGCLVSNEFPLFTCCGGKLLPEFLLSYMLLPENIASVNNLSGGMSSVSRKRFKEKDFLNFEVPQYDISFQKSICQKLKKICEIAASQDLESDTQLSHLNKLRQAVLQEAIEGKLTAEWRDKHPELTRGDNHASKLLEKIKAEKERLIKEGRIKKDKPLSSITDDEKPFDLPEGWVWCRLPQILDFGDSLRRGPFGSSITKLMFVPKSEHSTKVYEQKNAIYKDYTLGSYFMNLAEHPNLNGFLAGPGDIIISCAGTIGETYLLPQDAPRGIINQALLKIRLNQHVVDNQFFMIIFKAQTKLRINEDSKGTAMKNVSSVDYLKNELLFPLPPLAEQQAIVERADKLMSMIDELKKQISERKEQSEMLMQSVLREAFAKG